MTVACCARYHPRLKMSPEVWHDFGYAPVASDYSYFPDPPKKRPPTAPRPTDRLTNEAASCRAESERRAGKLLVHELMHLFGLDHCVNHACVMNGTGHLVEDFGAPSHLCPVDLRKMQWRLGFSVAGT